MSHRHTAIRDHTTAIEAARKAYNRENHCPCGNWLEFSPEDRYPRICLRCRIWSEVAS